MSNESIRVVSYETKYKQQVLDLHARVGGQHLAVRHFQWIGLFFKRHGLLQGAFYLALIAYAFHGILLIFFSPPLILSTILLFAYTLLVFFPYLSKAFQKQALRYTNSLESNDLDDIKSIYQSCPDKNFWVALDEKDQVCGCVALSNTMPLETQYHLGKYIKDKDNIKIAELKRVNVSDTHRRRGIANKLIGEATSFAKEQHFNAVVVTAISVNQPSIALYKKNGFFQVSTYFFQLLWKIFGIQIEVYLKLL